MAAPANGAAAPETVTAKLLDFSAPLDVALLDSTVNAFYGAGSNQEVRLAAVITMGMHVMQQGRQCGSRDRLGQLLNISGASGGGGHCVRLCLHPQGACCLSHVQRMAAEAVLKAVQEHPEAWTRVDAILEHSKNQQTKFFGLQVRRQLLLVQLPLCCSAGNGRPCCRRMLPHVEQG